MNAGLALLRIRVVMPGLAASSLLARFSSTPAMKEQLLKLRKQTGYSISNCKKALEETNCNYDQALQRLHKLAEEEGWAKASKLSGRSTTKGVVSILRHDANEFGSVAVLCEMMCESDFVAQNAEFRGLSERIVTQVRDEIGIPWLQNASPEGYMHHAIGDPAEKLVNVGNHVKLTIGRLGENIQLRRVNVLSATRGSNLWLSTYVHPRSSENTGPAEHGRVGTVLAIEHKPGVDEVRLKAFGTQLCQHIVGMNPQQRGPQMSDQQLQEWHQIQRDAANAKLALAEKEEERVRAEEGEEDRELDRNKLKSSVNLLNLGEQENRLLWQPFLLSPEMPVAEVCKKNHVIVHDFVRFGLGEELD